MESVAYEGIVHHKPGQATKRPFDYVEKDLDLTRTQQRTVGS